MKYICVTLACILLFLVSCQKEINNETTPPGGGVNGGGSTNGLLVRAIAITGLDTLTTLYRYDNQRRLETTLIDGKSGGIVLHNYQKLERDGAGRISRILQKIDYSGFASDTAVNNIHYPNATTMDYDYSVNILGFFGFSTIDSSVYTFSGGKLMSALSYISSSLLGLPPSQSARIDFTYNSSGNVSVMNMFSSVSTPGGPLRPVMNQTFTYGTSLNSVWAPGNAAQNYWIGGLANAKNEAITRIQADDLTNSSNSITTNTSYVLSGSKPTSATLTTNTGQVTRYIFYYQ